MQHPSRRLIRGKIRVPDPVGNGIRDNLPDGRMTDGANFIPAYQFGEAEVSTTSFWVGSDRGYGLIGPGSWSGDRSPLWSSAGQQANAGWRLAAVERATAVIRNPIINTPWVVERSDGTRLRLPLWVTDPMMAGTSPGMVFPVHPAGRRMVGQEFWETVLTHAIWWGRSPVVFIEAADGQPLPGTLRILNPFMVESQNGRWVIDPSGDSPLVTDFDGRFTLRGQTWRIMVVRGAAPNDDNDVPEGVLIRHWDTLRIGANVNRFVEGAFKSGVPSGFLKVSTPNTTTDQVQRLKDDWMSAHGRGAQSVAVLNATVDYTPISISPINAQANEQVATSAQQIAWAFTLDGLWLNQGTSGMNYNNSSDRRSDLVSISCKSWANGLMQHLSALLPYGTRIDVDWKRFAAPPLAELAPPILAMLQAGVVTVEEARTELGYSPTPETVGSVL